MQQNSIPKSYQHYLVVSLLLLFTGMTIALHQFKVPTIMGEVASSVSMSETSAPWLMSVFTVTGIFLSIPVGGLVQKISCKTIILLAALCVVAGSVLGAMAPNGALLLLSRIVEGFGYLLIAVVAPVAVTTLVHPSKIGSAMGIWACWVSLGQIGAFNITPFLFRSAGMGWRGIWLLYALVTAISAVCIHFFLRAPVKEAAPQDSSSEDTQPGSLREALANKNLMMVSFGFMSFNYILISMVTFFPVFAVSSGRMDLPQASFMASLPMILSLAGSPLMGKLADSKGYKKLYILTLICGGTGVFLLFWNSTFFMGVGIVLLGLVGASTPGIVFGSMSQLAGSRRQEGYSMGIAVTCQNLGMFFGAATFPALVTVTGGYGTAAILFLVLTTISVALAVLAKFQ